ncbi:hypothetical protein CUR178_02745 [Leishmania enriettii]|uniref:Uncharacterized protein n=1 Tax=Leishmania enriettii TaxID=5663 RepID=A0A836H6W9_LEIEN|nr:hypothetical protein CUR178_02745 [Leishmania enriettii]
MREYFLLVLFGLGTALLCISCCIGCNVRRRQRLQAVDLSNGRYNAAEGGGLHNAGGTPDALGQSPRPVRGLYQEIYYQQYPQGGGGYYGDTFRPGAVNVNYAEARSQRGTHQPMPATVLFDASSGAQVGNVNYAEYFPVARVAEASGACDAAAAVNTGTITRPEAVSPYGEAHYVPRASATPPQRSRQPSPSTASAALPASPKADLPPPQYQM